MIFFFYKRIISVLTLHKECYKVSETLTDLGVDGGDISVRSHHPHYADTEDINPGGTQNISQKMICSNYIFHNSGYGIFLF